MLLKELLMVLDPDTHVEVADGVNELEVIAAGKVYDIYGCGACLRTVSSVLASGEDRLCIIVC